MQEISGHAAVVLVSTRNPLNIGAAARAMSNFGFRRLRVVKPYAAAFREARSAVGAAEVLANAEEFKQRGGSGRRLRAGGRDHGDPSSGIAAPALASGEWGAHESARHLGLRRVAMLFGSEKVGLSNQDLSHCHWLMRIPTREEHISMNLGQAVAVCLYELVRDASAARVLRKSKACQRGRGGADHRSAAGSIACQRISEAAGRGCQRGKNAGGWCGG